MSKTKTIQDPIYHDISITPLMLEFIDTPEFQRLRNLKQLGVVYFVYPSATHTRFEHSLGVSYLAGIMVQYIQKNQPELYISDRFIELIRIAGLMHDIGHGPFSHVYEKINPTPSHEERGCTIFKNIVKKYNINLSEIEINIILKMIIPTLKDDWQYQIIANIQNHIDVDKIDYILRDCYHLGLSSSMEYTRIIHNCRVIDNQLCFAQKVQYDIYLLFSNRYRLHRQVYHHPVVIAYEKMVIDLLQDINYPFIQLTDYILYHHLHQDDFSKLDSLHTRKHWRLIKEERVSNNFILPENPNPKLFFYYKYSIGFANSTENPLNHIWIYSDLNIHKKYKLNPQECSFIIPKQCKETIFRIYKKY